MYTGSHVVLFYKFELYGFLLFNFSTALLFTSIRKPVTMAIDLILMFTYTFIYEYNTKKTLTN